MKRPASAGRRARRRAGLLRSGVRATLGSGGLDFGDDQAVNLTGELPAGAGGVARLDGELNGREVVAHRGDADLRNVTRLRGTEGIELELLDGDVGRPDGSW